jgi:4'-phosphopantetheinyl transferase
MATSAAKAAVERLASEGPESRAAIEALPAGECHVWLARAPAALPEDAVHRYEGWLTQEEWSRYQSFRFERHRHLYLLTRGVARATLSRYANVAPADWRFAAGSHGKPYVASPAGATWLAFNLSNTEGLVACAVARDVEVGVDVENMDRLDDPMSIADRFFSPREVGDLSVLPASRRRARFFAYWTLKEAYIKGRGLGLAIPLDRFSFLVDEEEPAIGLVIDERLGDDARDWQCERISIASPYALALLVRRGVRPDFVIRVREHAVVAERTSTRPSDIRDR